MPSTTYGTKLRAFVELSRLRIVVMVIVSCAVGYVLSYTSHFDAARLMWTLLGTGLLSAGSCALNCYIERDLDALMPRTRNRPLPRGVITPSAALAFGAGCVVIGAALLFGLVNALSGWLGLAATAIYLGMYTPSKRWTWWNTSIGAVPGAIPPLMGWAAGADHISFGGWVLFAMLFVWQHTHFLPIAWLFKDDYAAAGFRMLPCIDSSDKTFVLTMVTAVILLPLSAMLYGSGSQFVGRAYCMGACFGGIVLIASALHWWRGRSREGARGVLYVSLLYLPVLLGAAVVDRWI